MLNLNFKTEGKRVRVTGMPLYGVDPITKEYRPNKNYKAILIDPKNGETMYDAEPDFPFLDITGSLNGTVKLPDSDHSEMVHLGSYMTPRHGNYFDQAEYKVLATSSDVKDMLGQLKAYINGGKKSPVRPVVKTDRPVALYLRVTDNKGKISYRNMNQKVPVTIRLNEDKDGYSLFLGDRLAMEITPLTMQVIQNNYRIMKNNNKNVHKQDDDEENKDDKAYTIIGTYLKSPDYPTPAVYMNTAKASGEVCIHTTILATLMHKLHQNGDMNLIK